MPGQIKVTVKGSEYIQINLLEPFQGELKVLEERQYLKLRAGIVKLGFSFAVHIWRSGGKNFILDGHQRIMTARRMIDKEGFTCPPIPVNVVEAKDVMEAKRKVLAAASQYGKMQRQGLKDFMDAAQMGLDELQADFDFPEIEFEKFRDDFFTTPEQKESSGSNDLTHMGETKMVHTCPKCGFEFDGKPPQ